MVSYDLLLFMLKIKTTTRGKDSMPFLFFQRDNLRSTSRIIYVLDHLRSNLGIISGLGIICGRGSFESLSRPNVFTIFKNRRVSREMQHDRLKANTYTCLLRSRSRSGTRCGDGRCTWGRGDASWCDWETRWSLVDSRTAWDTAEATDLDISSDMFVSFPREWDRHVTWFPVWLSTWMKSVHWYRED